METENNSAPQTAQHGSLQRILVAAVLAVLTVFLGATQLGIMPWFTGASLTILHVPVLVGAILDGPIAGAAIGAAFGVYSLVQSNIAPAGIVDIAFQNPLVAIPPRVIFPVIAWLVYRGLSRLLEKAHKKLAFAAVPISSFIGSLVHTGLVLFVLGLAVGPALIPEGSSDVTVADVLAATFVANGIPEAIAAAFLVAVIVLIWTRISSRVSKVSD